MSPRGMRRYGRPTTEKMAEVSGTQMDPEEVVKMLSGMSVLRRAPRLQQFADAVAFLASDRAAGITATKINVTSGLVPPRADARPDEATWGARKAPASGACSPPAPTPGCRPPPAT
jgi:hypothetical protein